MDMNAYQKDAITGNGTYNKRSKLRLMNGPAWCLRCCINEPKEYIRRFFCNKEKMLGKPLFMILIQFDLKGIW